MFQLPPATGPPVFTRDLARVVRAAHGVDRGVTLFRRRMPRDDVDDAGQRVAAIHGRIGPARDFHALDVRDVERREIERAAARVGRVVDAHAVDQHQRVVRIRAAHVQRAGAAAAAHLVDVHAGDAAQDVAELGGLLDVEIFALEHGDVGRDVVRRGGDARAGDDDFGLRRGQGNAAVGGKKNPDQGRFSFVGIALV